MRTTIIVFAVLLLLLTLLGAFGGSIRYTEPYLEVHQEGAHHSAHHSAVLPEHLYPRPPSTPPKFTPGSDPKEAYNEYVAMQDSVMKTLSTEHFDPLSLSMDAPASEPPPGGPMPPTQSRDEETFYQPEGLPQISEMVDAVKSAMTGKKPKEHFYDTETEVNNGFAIEPFEEEDMNQSLPAAY